MMDELHELSLNTSGSTNHILVPPSADSPIFENQWIKAQKFLTHSKVNEKNSLAWATSSLCIPGCRRSVLMNIQSYQLVQWHQVFTAWICSECIPQILPKLLKYLSCLSLITMAVWYKQLQTLIYTFVFCSFT